MKNFVIMLNEMPELSSNLYCSYWNGREFVSNKDDAKKFTQEEADSMKIKLQKQYNSGVFGFYGKENKGIITVETI